MELCKQKPMGFAVSIDAFFALILLIALIGFVGTGALKIEENVPATKVSTLGQNLEDALTSFENTGFLAQKLNPTPTQASVDEIHAKLKELLPTNTETNIKVTRYAPRVLQPDLQVCRSTRAFEDCFDEIQTLTAGPAISISGEILAGRKLIMQKQAGRRIGAQDKCVLSGAADLKGKATNMLESILLLEGEEEIKLNTTVKDSDGTSYTVGPPPHALQCFDPDSSAEEQKDQIANITESVLSGTRLPVSVMLLVDRSGSTDTYDMKMKTTNGTTSNGTCNGSTCFACTLSNKNTQYDSFTNKQTVATYNLTQATINSIGTNNKLLFVVRPNDSPLYSGNCPVINSMVFWVTRPDESVEKDSGNNTKEDVLNPTTGNYGMLLWDDTTSPDSYAGIYLAKTPISNIVYNGSFSATTSWQNIGDTITVTDNTTYKMKYYFTYSGYNGSSYPRFRIRRDNHTEGSVNCGPAGAPSGSCEITIEDSYPGGSYANSGNYSIQVRLNSGSGTFNVNATIEMESCVNSSCYPTVRGSGTIGNGTCNGSICANCPKGTGLTGTSTATNVQTADAFAIGTDLVKEHYRGIYADIKNISVDPTAVCTAGIGFKNPVDGSNKNFYFSFPPSNSFCYEISPTGVSYTCSNDRRNSAVPLPSGDYNILAWSDKSVSYIIDWQEQRIDAAKTSAKNFLDNAQWKSSDRFGLAWFADNSASYSAPSGQPMTDNKDAVKTALNNLAPNGNTPMAIGITTARQGLNAESPSNLKFIILLTDGMANVRYPTSGCCPGGGYGCGSTAWPCVSDAISQADQARLNEITVFVIGAAEEAVFEGIVSGSSPPTTYETALRQLAKDQDDARYAAQCKDVSGNPILEAHCGKYYYAGDSEQLAGIYDLIVQEIGARIGAVDIHTTVPSNTEILCSSSCTPGQLYCSYSSGIINCTNEIPSPCTVPADCDGENDSWHEATEIVFVGQSVSLQEWLGNIKARIPCNSSACTDNVVTFPSAGSYIATQSGDITWGGAGTVCNPDCETTVPFYYNDLKGVFTDGTILAPEIVELTLEIRNNGYRANDLAQKPLLISFHQDSETGTLLSAESAGIASGGFTTALENISGINHVRLSGAVLLEGQKVEIRGIVINKTGLIYLKINEDNTVNQCTRNDSDWASCAEPETYYYVIDYSTWSKT